MQKLILSVILGFLFAVRAFAAVDINTADAAELQTLKGIGKAKAAAIIEYREANGGFKTPEEIVKVKGISQKMYDDGLAEQISVRSEKNPAQRAQPAVKDGKAAAAKPAAEKAPEKAASPSRKKAQP